MSRYVAGHGEASTGWSTVLDQGGVAAALAMVVAFTALGTVLLRLAGSSSSAASSTSIDTGPLAESR